ncbi:inactive pancreatic lipase-related protein 1-like [Condylostylus longicornis]|uniref:inactive pancreatic lipase-related protein 1-like n=1 Tax=Condylostylus longicornis TaxID=2530218 RepID=UPI00244DA6FA|nr:inactive pancreatic lipase-related protein 1-like [Condylostylus longicornis]
MVMFNYWNGQIVRTQFCFTYPDPWTNVRIYFYHGDKNLQNVSYQLKDANQLLENADFNIEHITTLYVHGYTETQERFSIPTLKRAYSYRKNYNFITLDYASYSKGDIVLAYYRAVNAVSYLTPFVSQALIKLFNAGLPIEKFHLIGHSLGGQFVGYIGRNIIAQTNGTKVLNRISSLDPAYPGFSSFSFMETISSNDAKFVDVIHTDAYFFGAPVQAGSVDFWPNGGKALQPGCPPLSLLVLDKNDFCSHWRSWKYWAESVANLYPEKFVAYKANTYSEFLTRPLSFYQTNEITLMGLQASRRQIIYQFLFF